MTRILLAGDGFVSPALLSDALAAEGLDGLDLTRLTLPWPDVPFGKVDDVDEASGTPEQMVEALEGMAVCLTQMAPITDEVLRASTDLRLVCVARGGPVNVNVRAATDLGVAVCAAPGRNAVATAEHTVALLLAVARRIPQRHEEIRQGQWRSDFYRYDQVGPEIDGATVGIVGYGAVGSRVAGLVRAMGARVIVYDPGTPPLHSADTYAETLEEMLDVVDVLSLHARLGPDNRHVIGAVELRRMKPRAILVNAARGGLVDYDALCDALTEERLFGAGLDVYDEEPLPTASRLRGLPNVVLTPHLAGATRQTAHRAAAIVAAEAGRYLRGEPLQHCVNGVEPGSAPTGARGSSP